MINGFAFGVILIASVMLLLNSPIYGEQVLSITNNDFSGLERIAANKITNKIYAPNTIGNSVSVINGTTDMFITTIPTGSNSHFPAVNEITNKIYVTNPVSNKVTVINGTTDTAITTIPVGITPIGIAINEAKNIVYVSNLNGQSVSVINGTTDTIIETISLGRDLSRLAVNEITDKIYVIALNSRDIIVINGTDNSVIKTITINSNGIGFGIQDVAVDAAKNKIYVAHACGGCFGGNAIHVINGTTDTNIKFIPVTSGPASIAINDVTDKIYVTHTGVNQVAIINGTSDTSITFLPIDSGNNFRGITVNTATNKIYAIKFDPSGTINNRVIVINGATDTVATTIAPVDTNPISITVNEVTNRVYVVNSGTRDVSVVNGVTNANIASIPLGVDPIATSVNEITNLVYVTAFNSTDGNAIIFVINGTDNSLARTNIGVDFFDIAINEITNTIYVTNSTGNNLSVIDGDTNIITATIPVGTTPESMAVNKNTNKIYVANSVSNDLSVIDGVTNTVIVTIPVGLTPSDVAVNEVTNLIYVTSLDSDDVTVIDGVTNTVITTIPVIDGSVSVAVNEIANRIYVVHSGVPPDNSVFIIDGVTNTIVTSLPLGRGPSAVEVNENTSRFYVVETFSNQVRIFGPTTPSSPVNLAATAISPSQINLIWDTPTDNGGAPITGYQILRKIPIERDFSTLTADTATALTTFFDALAIPFTLHSYQAAAINAAGIGPSSTIVTASTPQESTTSTTSIDPVPGFGPINVDVSKFYSRSTYDPDGFGPGKSLVVHEISYNKKQNKLELILSTTAPPANVQIKVDMQRYSIPLDQDQPYLSSEKKLSYSTPLPNANKIDIFVNDRRDNLLYRINLDKDEFRKTYYNVGYDKYIQKQKDVTETNVQKITPVDEQKIRKMETTLKVLKYSPEQLKLYQKILDQMKRVAVNQ